MRWLTAVTVLAIGVLGACGESAGPAEPEPVASVSVSPGTDTVLVGTITQLVATLRDQAGNVLGDRTVSWASSAEAVATVSPTGQVSGAAVGSATITATAEGKNGSAAVVVEVLPAIRALSGDAQVDTVSRTLGEALVVQVTGVDAQPAAGVVVTFGITGGGGSLSATAATTDAAGLGSTVLTLGTVAGANTVTATASGLSGSSLTLRATALPDVPALLARVSGDGQDGFIGRALYDSLVVRVWDRFQNAVSGVSVGWTVTNGGGTVSAPATITGPSGLATVTWTLGPTPGPNGLEGTLATLAPVGFAATGVSPGSGRIAFMSDRTGDFEIWVMNADGTGGAQLTNSPDWDRHPTWSPDGSRIAFFTVRYGSAAIAVMNADGSGVVPVFNLPGDSESPAWSPDGSRIAFERNPGNGGYDIWVVNPDGTGLRSVTSNMTNAGNPTWSPDGSKIAFWGRIDRYTTEPADTTRGLYVISGDGTGMVRVLTGRFYNPAWSPDGSKLAFDRDFNGIYLMNPDGAGLVQLQTYGSHPAWSPDGSKIVFARDGLYSMNADGTGVVRLENRGGNTPAWGR